VLWQRFWLDLCTKQVVSTRACANQFLPYSSSGIVLFGMKTVQADSCLNSEQIYTTFISVRRQEGGFGGGGGILGRRTGETDRKICYSSSDTSFSPVFPLSVAGNLYASN
jgi:hypothetical protein